MKIAVISVSIGLAIEKIAKLTFPINNQYCLRHNYDFMYIANRLDNNRHPSWTKILFALKVLNMAKKYDYVWVIDADLMIMNHTTKIESIVELYPNADLIFSSDLANSPDNQKSLVNTGSFIIKNSNFSRSFLQTWFNTPCGYEYSFPWEQGAINTLLTTYPMVFKLHDKIKILPEKTLNSIFDSLSPHDNFNQGDFVLHLMALPLEVKERVFKEFVKFIVTD